MDLPRHEQSDGGSSDPMTPFQTPSRYISWVLVCSLTDARGGWFRVALSGSSRG